MSPKTVRPEWGQRPQRHRSQRGASFKKESCPMPTVPGEGAPASGGQSSHWGASDPSVGKASQTNMVGGPTCQRYMRKQCSDWGRCQGRLPGDSKGPGQWALEVFTGEGTQNTRPSREEETWGHQGRRPGSSLNSTQDSQHHTAKVEQ